MAGAAGKSGMYGGNVVPLRGLGFRVCHFVIVGSVERSGSTHLLAALSDAAISVVRPSPTAHLHD